jgi:hypothetical protein
MYSLLFSRLTRRGSVDDQYTNSPTGSTLVFFKNSFATNHWIADTEVLLSVGHKGTKVISTIARRA